MVTTITAILLLSCVIFIYPLWMTMVQSFSPPNEADSLGFKFWPKEWSTASYKYLLVSKPTLWIGYKNTIINTVIVTAMHLLITFLGAYGLTRRDMPFKTGITLFIVFTMFFSGGLIPSYLLVRDLGLMNTRWALILPGMASAWNL